MRYVLARSHRGVLGRFAGPRTLLAFDFDGTLAPIVAEPARAAMRPTTRALLRRAARAYPCIVLTGRSREDAARRVRGIPLAAVIGNHGLEGARPPTRTLRRVRRWAGLLEPLLADVPGVVIEDKGLSLAVHYRRSRRRELARARILEAAARLGGTRLVGGKRVVNVLPAGGPDKGQALEKARARLRCDRAVYVGDDETDEDVFSLGQPRRLLSIRVGRKAGSAAAYYIRTQVEIDAVLATLMSSWPTTVPGRRPSR
jgi:trehalose 6-phosphate phosphatase